MLYKNFLKILKVNTKKINGAIFLISFSRKAAYWNLCLYKIVRLLNRKVNGLKVWNKALKVELKCQYIVGLFMNLKLKWNSLNMMNV